MITLINVMENMKYFYRGDNNMQYQVKVTIEAITSTNARFSKDFVVTQDNFKELEAKINTVIDDVTWFKNDEAKYFKGDEENDESVENGSC